MKLNFRQGIVKHQTDVNGNPIFLQRSAASGQFIDLIVSPDSTMLAFAHRTSTYIVEELKTITNAWGPLEGAGIKYLFWDVSLLSGALTRGLTLEPPLYSSGAPPTPSPDQYWFNTIENVGRVWNGTKWVEKLRIFAGYITSNAIIHPAPVGSEAGLIGDFEGGHIMLDSLGSPLRQSNGLFVTTTTWLNVINLGATTARLEEAIMSGMAAEELPKYSMVQLRRGRQLLLARSSDITSRVSGMVTSDMYEGEVDTVISVGVVKNSEWSYSDADINRVLFCGTTGQVTLLPPTQGVLQQIGFVYDTDAIFLDIKPVIVLDNPFNTVAMPEPQPISVPIANFTVSETSGIAPFVVEFIDTSVDGTAREWDFTNDGIIDAVTKTASYTYSIPGIYTVRMRSTNTFGQDSEIKSNIITVLNSAADPVSVNLGLSFGAPNQVISGETFSFQVITSNDGASSATSVSRIVNLRSDDGTAVTISSSPLGSSIDIQGVLTVVTLPLVNIMSGGSIVSVLQAFGESSARSIQLNGTVTSPEVDSTMVDNTANLTITVSP
jgi:PKD repeat protein